MKPPKILADSITPSGKRLVTVESTMHRFVLPEVNTVRMFSRNSASSRAIPIEKTIQRVFDDPAVPVHWGANQKGMQAENEVGADLQAQALVVWLDARDNAVESARRLLEVGVHKQVTNRLLEPFMAQTMIISATEWGNTFALRCHPDAQPEIRAGFEAIREAMWDSDPVLLEEGEWHLPLISQEDRDEVGDVGDLLKISAGRCARVSYLTHDGRRDLSADVALHDMLVSSGHMSPLEHQARPLGLEDNPNLQGNFKGWAQYRKMIPNEHDFGLVN